MRFVQVFALIVIAAADCSTFVKQLQPDPVSPGLSVYSGVGYSLYNAADYSGPFVSVGVGDWGAFGGDSYIKGTGLSGDMPATFGFSYSRTLTPWQTGSASASWTDYRMIGQPKRFGTMAEMIPLSAAWGAITTTLFSGMNLPGIAGGAAAASFLPYGKWKKPETIRYKQTHNRAGDSIP